MNDMNKDINLAQSIANAVAEAGGRAYFVGGFVRDRLLGRTGKDIDIEIHGITPAALEAILDLFGERTAMGSSFGIYGLKHCGIDIAMPRKENATGRGHKDFAVFVDPFLGTTKAAMRRDFTVNAMMEDVLTGEIVDPFGGQEDLRQGILRHVSDESFPEDALRVLRAAQFAARFELRIAPETLALCKRMSLSDLPRERVMGEMEKALLTASHPSVFFETLRTMDQLEVWFPELSALIGVEQDPGYHPEGDVWQHTMLTLDGAATLRSEAKEPLFFMLAALTHDFGKAVTTARGADGRLHAIMHEKEGLPIVRRFLDRLTGEVRLSRYVLSMVENHMRPNLLSSAGSTKKAYMKLFDACVCPEDLLLLARADRLGQGCKPGQYTMEEMRQREMLAAYRALDPAQQVMGVDLIAAGLAPGPRFSELLAFTHKLWLSGVPKGQTLAQVLSTEGIRTKKKR